MTNVENLGRNFFLVRGFGAREKTAGVWESYKKKKKNAKAKSVITFRFVILQFLFVRFRDLINRFRVNYSTRLNLIPNSGADAK